VFVLILRVLLHLLFTLFSSSFSISITLYLLRLPLSFPVLLPPSSQVRAVMAVSRPDLEGGGAFGTLRKFSSMQLNVLTMAQAALTLSASPSSSSLSGSRSRASTSSGVAAAALATASNAVSLLPVTSGGFFSKADPAEVVAGCNALALISLLEESLLETPLFKEVGGRASSHFAKEVAAAQKRRRSNTMKGAGDRGQIETV
jgi:hypothetical protein